MESWSAAWCFLPLIAWVAHTMVDMIVRELGAYLYAQKKLADQRLRDSTRHLDDAIADVIAKVEADIAAGDLEPVPIDVTHDAVGIDGSCIRVR